MSSIYSNLKKKLITFIELFPYGRDCYLYLTRNRQGISYRGIFASYEQARDRTIQKEKTGYDVINKNKASNEENVNQGLDNWFHNHDYPLLFWLNKIANDQDKLVELGGSLGHFYYSSQRFVQYPKSMTWTIAELPEAVQLGQKLATKRGETRLTFTDSEQLNELDPATIFMTAGTIQYMPSHLSQLLKDLKSLPNNVLVHNLPCHENREYWTLQNLRGLELPYRIYSRDNLLKNMEELGYSLVADWCQDREIVIPFHSELHILGYAGFYFRLEQGAKPL